MGWGSEGRLTEDVRAFGVRGDRTDDVDSYLDSSGERGPRTGWLRTYCGAFCPTANIHR